MKRISLGGVWRFLGREPQPCEPQSVNLPDTNSSDWLTIAVPGDVNQALLNHGKIPDPHFDVNARQCYRVTSKEWWYAKTFNYDLSHKENAELFLDGIDGPSDAWLNGKYLGTMANYFHPHSFDVTNLLQAQNTLLIRFQSIDQYLGNPRCHEIRVWKNGCYIRKPQFSFGWDWALPLPSIGLGGEVTLNLDNRENFYDFGFRTYKSGRIDFFFEVSKAARDAGYEITIQVRGHGVRVRARLRAAFTDHYGAPGNAGIFHEQRVGMAGEDRIPLRFSGA